MISIILHVSSVRHYGGGGGWGNIGLSIIAKITQNNYTCLIMLHQAEYMSGTELWAGGGGETSLGGWFAEFRVVGWRARGRIGAQWGLLECSDGGHCGSWSLIQAHNRGLKVLTLIRDYICFEKPIPGKRLFYSGVEKPIKLRLF